MRPPPGALATDFYQLTMAHAYFERGMHDTAVFEMFARQLPKSRRFLLAAGLEQALACAEALQFSAGELEFLAGLGSFPRRFLDFLGTVRFTGSIHAMPEGTAFFADEPMLRVTAPIIEAQLLESRLLNILHFQTLIASKAARCRIAAQGLSLFDFGFRRAHEADAGVLAARAAYLAGFDGTATVEAGLRFGIPLSGTLAHSYIEAHELEEQAFEHFVLDRPGAATLLIDTYDTQRAAHRVAALARRLKAQGVSGHSIQSVRIDSGDLGAEARAVRTILDREGCPDIRIVLSGGLDETAIAALVAADVPVDAFGVGTALDVSMDAAALDMVYKLQMYGGRACRKRSVGKATWPGAKQVFREFGADGLCLRDHVVEEAEEAPGERLLWQFMGAGRRVGVQPSLAQGRARCRAQLAALPPKLRDLAHGAASYPVGISRILRSLAAQVDTAQH
jgi:nicotinate phosphoribosyltransferase